MAFRATTHSRMFSRVAGIACLIALGVLLAGCDKCGDWPWSPAGGTQSCRQGPKPQ